jgi:hypothetical protein
MGIPQVLETVTSIPRWIGTQFKFSLQNSLLAGNRARRIRAAKHILRELPALLHRA